ncbi:hypothetical protein SKAU_G00192790 [Synaphobranchus kaupii]|uniref:Uncharacterized protein n=1 Tax=Synaphobranchus kaupii TaxID=118154 RepID=A0A9Q1IXK3_SYNKA|nr:hypothetical protein SKAU_G00192790 [Synaphobranchus kaupii]
MSRYLPSKMRKVKVLRKPGGRTQNQTWRVQKELQSKHPDRYFRLKVKETLEKGLAVVLLLLAIYTLHMKPQASAHMMQDRAQGTERRGLTTPETAYFHTKQLAAPGVMAPLLYQEKPPWEDEHELQDITYTNEC